LAQERPVDEHRRKCAMVASSPGPRIIVLEDSDENYTPSKDQVLEYAEYIGIDADCETHLMWIAREGVAAKLPHPWKACTENGDDIFYFDFESGESLWDHPCDEKYRDLVDVCRKKGEVMINLLDACSMGMFVGRGAGLGLGSLGPIDEDSVLSGFSVVADSDYANDMTSEESSDADCAEQQRTLASTGANEKQARAAKEVKDNGDYDSSDASLHEGEEAIMEAPTGEERNYKEEDDDDSSDDAAVAEALVYAAALNNADHCGTEDSDSMEEDENDLEPHASNQCGMQASDSRLADVTPEKSGWQAIDATPEKSGVSCKPVMLGADSAFKGSATAANTAIKGMPTKLKRIQTDLRSVLGVLGKLRDLRGQQREHLLQLRGGC